MAEPRLESCLFALLKSGAVSVNLVDGNTQGLPWVVECSGCVATADALYNSPNSGSLVRWTNGSGYGRSPNCQGDVRGFPSNAVPDTKAWGMLAPCTDELDAIRLISNASPARIKIPEAVLAARLLRSGRVIVVGQRGGIYNFDSLEYGDCCTIATAPQGARLSFQSDGTE